MSTAIKITVLLLTGALLREAPAQLNPSILSWDGTTATILSLPQTLSTTGFDPANSAVFVPYEVNVPQYRSFMTAQRYVSVPAGTSIIPGDSLDYIFPAGTAFIRVIGLDTVLGDPSTRRMIEVQIQVRSADGQWHRLAYVYRDDGSEADLINGTNLALKYFTVNIKDKGLPYYDLTTKLPADTVRFQYLRLVLDCRQCHWNTSTNGFITQQLNKGAQLQDMVNRGILANMPDLNAMAARGMVVKWVDKNGTADLETKALSYLGANCSHCHNHLPERATSGMASGMQYFRPPAFEFPDFVTEAVTFVPGKPDTSPSIVRLQTSNMPAGGEVSLPDAVAIKMLWDWTNSLDGDPSNDRSYDSWVDIGETHENKFSSRFSAYYKNDMLRLNGHINPRAVVRLYTLTGRNIQLLRITDRTLQVTKSLDPGIYLLKVNETAVLLPVR
jgi:hypothetical protein